ncbi:MAG: MFS transporter, partial [Gammaproteobacteria bacterium]
MPWLVWGLGASLFFSQYLGRIAPGIMVPELTAAFQVTALSLGTLSAFFYLAYVSLQLPVGMLVDRYGPRLLLPLMGGLYVVGCVTFAQANQLGYAETGRFLMGLGAAFTFVSTLKLATNWFPASRIGLLAGFTQSIGMLGAAVGRAPVSYAVSSLGWRETMLGIAVICFIIVSLIIWIVRDHPPRAQRVSTLAKAPPHPVSVNMLTSLRTVLRNPQTWINALFLGLLYAPTAAFAELWGVVYLSKTYSLSNHEAAFGVGLMFIGWGIAGPFAGWFSDYLKKRRCVMLGSALSGTILMLCILYLPGLPVWCIYILLFLFGVSNTGVAVAYALSSEINARSVAGTSIAFANMSSVLIGAASQPLIGALLDIFQNFSLALSLLPLCLA